MSGQKKDVKFTLGDEDDGPADDVNKGTSTPNGISNSIPIPRKSEPAPVGGSPTKAGGAVQAAELAMSPRTMIR